MNEYLLEDCLKVANRSSAERVGLLVYASHKRYGGGYRNHSAAQEEYLFNNTTLPQQEYPKDFYPLAHNDAGGFAITANSKNIKKEIIFIFVPAPVWKINSRKDILKNRAKVIFNIAKQERVKHLILGGWGCGIFKCPPKLVAKTLHSLAPNDLKITYAFLDPKLKEIFEQETK